MPLRIVAAHQASSHDVHRIMPLMPCTSFENITSSLHICERQSHAGDNWHLDTRASTFASRLTVIGYCAVSCCQVVGRCNTSVSDEICSKVDELEASVVVLSVQPTSFLEGWLYPPISKQVAEKCTRPTLIFHG